MANSLLVGNPVIILNGPPRSGKDTVMRNLISKPVTNSMHFACTRMSAPMKQSIAFWLGQDVDTYDNAPIEAMKDMAIVGFNGLTYRQMQIKLFEHMSETYGKDILGKLLRRRMLAVSQNINKPVCFIVPDGGRVEEVQPIINTMGADKIILIRLHRKGCTFEGDIRDYIIHPDITTYDVENKDNDPDYMLNTCRHYVTVELKKART